MNKPKPCPKCDGQGVVSVFGEHTIVVVDCEECGGDGHIYDCNMIATELQQEMEDEDAQA